MMQIHTDGKSCCQEKARELWKHVLFEEHLRFGEEICTCTGGKCENMAPFRLGVSPFEVSQL